MGSSGSADSGFPRIALTHAFSWPEVRRGAERLVAELARHLAALGAEVTSFSSAFDHGTAERDGVRWVQFRRRHEAAPAAEHAFGRRVLPALATGRFDIVHSFGRYDAAASLRAARLHPRRATVHTDIGLPMRSQWEHSPADARLVERVVAGVDEYGCMSRSALELLASEYGREGALLPGGVDLDAFAPGARSTDPTVLFAGAIDVPSKGVAVLLDAWPMVLEQVPGARLVLSGPGELAPLLHRAPPGVAAHVDHLGVGTLDDLPALYASAWACALPSLTDTFGLVLIEALASGTPIVTGNRYAPPELVEPGRTGVVCDPLAVDAVAAGCVTALMLSRAPGVSERCRASVARFDWRTAVAPRHLEVYQAAIRARTA